MNPEASIKKVVRPALFLPKGESCPLCNQRCTIDGPSNSDVYERQAEVCTHLLCTPCHMRLKKEKIHCCPFCKFNMSEWQSHLRYDGVYNDKDGYNLEEQGYIVFGFWLPEDEWKKCLEKAMIPAVKQPTTKNPKKRNAAHIDTDASLSRATFNAVTDKDGRIRTLLEIKRRLCEMEGNDGHSQLTIDNWTFVRYHNTEEEIEYEVTATGAWGVSSAVKSSLADAYRMVCVPAATTTW